MNCRSPLLLTAAQESVVNQLYSALNFAAILQWMHIVRLGNEGQTQQQDAYQATVCRFTSKQFIWISGEEPLQAVNQHREVRGPKSNVTVLPMSIAEGSPH